jgi:hypothetical protein
MASWVMLENWVDREAVPNETDLSRCGSLSGLISSVF